MGDRFNMEKSIISFKLSKGYCFLISTKEGYMLIDTGYDYDYKLLETEMKRNSISYSDISYIFLSHHHDDHSGLVNYIIDRNPAIRVIMNRLCAELIKTGANDKTRGGGYVSRRVYYLSKINKLLHPEWNLTFPPYRVRDIDIVFVGDDENLLRHLGVCGKIIHTPGHTIDSASILMDDGSLFAADAAANFLNFAGTKYSPVFITDATEYYLSWEKMIAAGAKVIYPAHGKPFSVEKLKENIWKLKNNELVKFF